LEYFLIKGGKPLKGSVRISGSKNAALPIIAASILSTDNKVVLRNIPVLKDIETMIELLRSINVDIKFNRSRKEVIVKPTAGSYKEPPYDLVRKMRASFNIMGPLLAKKNKIRIPFPGGCAIGTRPIDLHLKGFNLMGVKIEISSGYVVANSKHLHGSEIYLDFPSVGATENIMMAAVMAKGETIIRNPAREPEIVDLANFLNCMGADIEGAGSDTIRIRGVESLTGCTYRVIPDRIEAGTYLLAGAITRGKVKVTNVIVEHLASLIDKLKESGIQVLTGANWVEVRAFKEVRGINVKTLPYPGFPTDLQSQIVALLCTAKGTSIVTEGIFDKRTAHVPELKRMGADISVDGNNIIINGKKKLSGAEVIAPDLRAGASLILAGLAAEGTTKISDIYHIDRGYENIEEKISKLGGYIKRIGKESVPKAANI